MSMSGLMFIEMESFNESKQESGYGVDWQMLCMEVRFGLREFVEEMLRPKVDEKKMVMNTMNIVLMGEAIELRGFFSFVL